MRRLLVTMLPAMLVVSVVASPPGTALDPEIASGQTLISEGDYEGAVATLERTVARLERTSLDPKGLAKAYLYLGIAHVGLGQDERARASFRAALAHDPKLAVAAAEVPGKARRILQEEHDARNRKRAGWGAWPYVLASGGVAGATTLAIARASSTPSTAVQNPAVVCLGVSSPLSLLDYKTPEFTLVANQAGSVRWDYGDGTVEDGAMSVGYSSSFSLCPFTGSIGELESGRLAGRPATFSLYYCRPLHAYQREGDYRVTATYTDAAGRTYVESAAVHIRSLSGKWYGTVRSDSMQGVYYLTQKGGTVTGYCSPCNTSYSGSINASIETTTAGSACVGTIVWNQGSKMVSGQICGEWDIIRLGTDYFNKDSQFH